MENLDDSVFNQYPYWIAHYYVNKLQYKGPWTFWQYTDVGRIDGIGHNDRDFVDCNIFNGNLRQLHDMTIHEQQLENID